MNMQRPGGHTARGFPAQLGGGTQRATAPLEDSGAVSHKTKSSFSIHDSAMGLLLSAKGTENTPTQKVPKKVTAAFFMTTRNTKTLFRGQEHKQTQAMR